MSHLPFNFAFSAGRTECPPGHVYNPRSGRCVRASGQTAQRLGLTDRTGRCPPGSTFEVRTGRCRRLTPRSFRKHTQTYLGNKMKNSAASMVEISRLRSEVKRLKQENEHLRQMLDNLSHF